MTNEEIIQEMREVREMNERREQQRRMTPEEIAAKEKAEKLIVKWQVDGNIEAAPHRILWIEEMWGDITRALIEERKAAIKEEREAFLKIVRKEIRSWDRESIVELEGSIDIAISARSS